MHKYQISNKVKIRTRYGFELDGEVVELLETPPDKNDQLYRMRFSTGCLKVWESEIVGAIE